MALLNSMIRAQAIYGRSNTISSRCLSRQGGRWAQQLAHDAVTPSRLGELKELHERGVVTDDEFAQLRARFGG